eukprot:8968368-Lingulodinium_polyedra.AAC.1
MPQMMMPMPMPMPMSMPMMGQLQPQMPTQAADACSSSTSTSSDESKERYRKGEDNSITTSAKFLGKLPKVRLLQMLEASSTELDSTLTANLEQDDLCRLIYIVCKIRPNTKTAHLRVKNYKDRGASRNNLL